MPGGEDDVINGEMEDLLKAGGRGDVISNLDCCAAAAAAAAFK